MEKKLTITKEQFSNYMLLKVAGRLDANWSGYLDDTLKELVQEGTYFVSLDLTNISYLSSAGIRILVKQNKAFDSISGELSITAMSENVSTVLDMVGMSTIFNQSKPIDRVQTTKSKVLKKQGFSFSSNENKQNTTAPIRWEGTPEKIKDGSFTKSDNNLLKLDDPFFGIGIGAIGENYEDCQSRFGEFIALGETAAYLPTDGGSSPDYTIKTGKLIPEINTLYYIGNKGEFSNRLLFTPDTEKSIALSSIIESAMELGNHKNFSFLLIAESAGLIGSSLNISPINKDNPFHFPEVREHINFTTEPTHNKEIAIAYGVVLSDVPKEMSCFVRPLNKELQTHVHAAIFPYAPLRKDEINYTETINNFFNNSEVLDIMHLLNDSRDINGLGESLFRSGHCWTSELKF